MDGNIGEGGIPFYNAGATTIPPYGAIEVTGYSSGFFQGRRPVSASLPQVLINGPHAVPAATRGTAANGRTFVGMVQDGSTTTPGTEFGTDADENGLLEGSTGFVCLGPAPGDTSEGLLVWLRPFNAAGSLWEYTKGTDATITGSDSWAIPVGTSTKYSPWETINWNTDPIEITSGFSRVNITFRPPGYFYLYGRISGTTIASAFGGIDGWIQLGDAAGNLLYTSFNALVINWTAWPGAQPQGSMTAPVVHFQRDGGAPAYPNEIHQIRAKWRVSTNEACTFQGDFAASVPTFLGFNDWIHSDGAL